MSVGEMVVGEMGVGEMSEYPFVNAEKSCVQLGGHLASIHNGFTNAFLSRLFFHLF